VHVEKGGEVDLKDWVGSLNDRDFIGLDSASYTSSMVEQRGRTSGLCISRAVIDESMWIVDYLIELCNKIR
jgi:hypothetical protein